MGRGEQGFRRDADRCRRRRQDLLRSWRHSASHPRKRHLQPQQGRAIVHLTVALTLATWEPILGSPLTWSQSLALTWSQSLVHLWPEADPWLWPKANPWFTFDLKPILGSPLTWSRSLVHLWPEADPWFTFDQKPILLKNSSIKFISTQEFDLSQSTWLMWSVRFQRRVKFDAENSF